MILETSILKNQILKRVNNFGFNIWGNEIEHERNAEWVRDLNVEKDNMKQNDTNITTEMITAQAKRS